MGSAQSAAVDVPPIRTQFVERITCGASHPNPAVERRIQEARYSEGAPVDRAGCGRTLVWTVAFRCVDCGRWFHRDCIQKHFAAHAAPEEMQRPLILSPLDLAVRRGLTAVVQAASYPFQVGSQLVASAISMLRALGPSITVNK